MSQHFQRAVRMYSTALDHPIYGAILAFAVIIILTDRQIDPYLLAGHLDVNPRANILTREGYRERSWLSKRKKNQ